MRVLVQLAAEFPESNGNNRHRLSDFNLKDTLIRPLAFAKPRLRFGGARSATFSRKREKGKP
jgi:hypothetical protein